MIKKRNSNLHPGYNTIVDKVLPCLDGFHNDILECDKKTLSGYKGRFILAYGKSGANIFLIDAAKMSASWKIPHLESSPNATFNYRVKIVGLKQKFLLLDIDGKSKDVPKEEVISLLETNRDETLSVLETMLQFNLSSMAFEIEYFISNNGRKWKSILLEQHDILKKFNIKMQDSDIYQVLIDDYIQKIDSDFYTLEKDK